MYRVSTQNRIDGGEKNIADLMQELALGIAHDVRNPLAAAKGVLALIDLQHKEDSKLLAQSKLISTQIDYASRTLSSFYELFNPAKSKLGYFDVVEHCSETVRIFTGLAMLHGVVIVEDYAYCGKALINVQGLTQIMINFLKNAIDVAREGEKIRVGTFCKNNKVIIFVQDTGIGMDEETLQNVFRAYFSTKSMGTGLGLNISMHIASYLGWEIEAESAPGEGTTFSLIVPKI